MRQTLSNLPRPSRSLVLRGGLALAGLVAVLALLNRFVDISQDDMESWIDGAGVLAPITYAVVLFLGLTIPFNPVSDLLTVTVAALLLDPWVAILATFAAQAASISLNYRLARWYGPGIMRRLKKRNVPLVARIERHITLKTVFLFRFALPLTGIGVDFISYLSGIRRLRFAPFFAATMVPWTLLSVIYFVSAGMLREVSPGLVLVPALILLAVTSLVVLVIRRIIGPTRAPADSESERVNVRTGHTSGSG